ncbi:MAG: hypothetical protein HZT39_09800 [Pseudoxanthomonas sp.]|nr:MAG: hypothetical protein HZT39_09800 [Pseudoxanthomonas sp.]
MPKFRVIEGKPDTSPAGQVRRRTRESARDWPACPHCGGREVVQAKIGNVKNDLCVACLLTGKRVVVE